jgi:hypothetical protein
VTAGARSRPERETTIERATLVKIARDTAAQRMQARPSLLSAYLTGSVAAGEPMLGDATDIDLILIDALPPPAPREIIRLTDQVVLDIQHRSRDEYANARSLRVHPWRGPELAEPLFLLDPAHFFELAQSSARGQFHRPENVAARARTFCAWARADLHIGVLPGAEPEAPVTIAALCQALLNAANAAISLTAFPAGGRRLVGKLEAAARRLGRLDIYTGLVALFGGEGLPAADAERFRALWSATYRAGQSATDELIHPARRTVYERGFRAQAQADRAPDMLWLMTATWNACLRNIPAGSPHPEAWAAYLERLGLAPASAYAGRVAQAVDYVDLVTALVEDWAEHNGA